MADESKTTTDDQVTGSPPLLWTERHRFAGATDPDQAAEVLALIQSADMAELQELLTYMIGNVTARRRLEPAVPREVIEALATAMHVVSKHVVTWYDPDKEPIAWHRVDGVGWLPIAETITYTEAPMGPNLSGVPEDEIVLHGAYELGEKQYALKCRILNASTKAARENLEHHFRIAWAADRRDRRAAELEAENRASEPAV